MNYFEQETERLHLRKLTLDDIPSWTEFFENNDRLHFLGLDPALTNEELATGWISKQLERYRDEGLGMLAIVDKKSDELIGLSGIVPRELNGENYFEIAYSFKPKVWGKGYATEATRQLKKFGFKAGISELFISIIDLDNFASQAVAKRNGMNILFTMEYLGMEVYIFGTEN